MSPTLPLSRYPTVPHSTPQYSTVPPCTSDTQTHFIYWDGVELLLNYYCLYLTDFFVCVKNMMWTVGLLLSCFKHWYFWVLNFYFIVDAVFQVRCLLSSLLGNSFSILLYMYMDIMIYIWIVRLIFSELPWLNSRWLTKKDRTLLLVVVNLKRCYFELWILIHLCSTFQHELLYWPLVNNEALQWQWLDTLVKNVILGLYVVLKCCLFRYTH